MRKSTKDKYYTPKAEEFHIGFEYEGFNEDEEWEKTIFQDGRSVEYYEDNRVKLLDKDDFLDLDFNRRIKEDVFYGKIEMFTKNIGSQFASVMTVLTIKNIDGKFLFEIAESGSYSQTLEKFWLNLKNKSELIKILKQLDLK